MTAQHTHWRPPKREGKLCSRPSRRRRRCPAVIAGHQHHAGSMMHQLGHPRHLTLPSSHNMLTRLLRTAQPSLQRAGSRTRAPIVMAATRTLTHFDSTTCPCKPCLGKLNSGRFAQRIWPAHSLAKLPPPTCPPARLPLPFRLQMRSVAGLPWWRRACPLRSAKWISTTRMKSLSASIAQLIPTQMLQLK